MGFEPTTPTLARLCSTPELHPHPSPPHHTGARRVCKIRPDFGRRDILPPALLKCVKKYWFRGRSSLTFIKSFGMAQRARPGIHEHRPVHSILKPVCMGSGLAGGACPRAGRRPTRGPTPRNDDHWHSFTRSTTGRPTSVRSPLPKMPNSYCRLPPKGGAVRPGSNYNLRKIYPVNHLQTSGYQVTSTERLVV